MWIEEGEKCDKYTNIKNSSTPIQIFSTGKEK